MSVSAAFSRQRSQSRTKETYNPDLEFTQQSLANEMYGPGAPIGSYGMSGGQYVGDQATQGFGTNRYGDQGKQYYNPNTAGANVYGNAGPTGYNQYGMGAGYGVPPGGGDGYGGGGQYDGYGGGPWGAGGASGNLNLAGGAAYGGYSGIAQDYARMGARGVTPQERANLMAASNEAIQAQGRATRDQMANRLAQSGNTAGYYGAQARLGANLGQSLVGADRANQIAIMQEDQRRREAALQGRLGATQGQAGLYGTTAGYASNLLNTRARLASLRQQGHTEGAGTSGTVSGSYGAGGGMGFGG